MKSAIKSNLARLALMVLFLRGSNKISAIVRTNEARGTSTSVLPPHRGGAVPSSMGMGRNGQISQGARPKDCPHCRGLFCAGLLVDQSQLGSSSSN